MKNVWNKKPLPQLLSESQNGLKKSLTRFNLITLGIGAIVGAGLFVLTGTAAADYAGPAVTFSFIIAAVACAFAGMCYAELASMIPISGSAYTYSYVAFGEVVAWLIGWNLVFGYLLSASTVAVGWSAYLVDFLDDFHILIPSYLTNPPFTFDSLTGSWQSTGAFVNLPAVFIIVLFSTLLVRGIHESAMINNIIVMIKLIIVFVFIGFGFSYIHPENWHPFVPANTGGFGQFGISGVMRAAGIIFFAYIGFDAVSTAAQEARNPQRDMPWGILGSLVICTVIYVIFSITLTGMSNYTHLNDPAPVIVAINEAGSGLHWLRKFVEVGALAGLSSVMLVNLIGQSRVFYAMSVDGLLPPAFKRVHQKYRTPWFSTVFTGLAAAAAAGLLPLDLLGELVSIGVLPAFAAVSIGVLVLRYRHPDVHRPFRTPFFPYFPILGAMTSIGIMLTLPETTWLRLIVWLALGCIIYFCYGLRHSNLQQNPKTG